MTPRKKVLLVDNDPWVRDVVAATLGNDFVLLEAACGHEALEVAQYNRPDLIVLDVIMPEPDGFEVCRRLKLNPATCSIRVVMLTALGSAADRKAAQEVGADAYFAKPFSPRSLLATVHELLGSPSEPIREAPQG